MRLERPYTPLDVRCQVIARQLIAAGKLATVLAADTQPTMTAKLLYMLQAHFGAGPCHLDHDPPLCLRHRRKNGRYVPDANDPKYLIWRTAEDHHIKTYVRGDGAQLSDAGKRRKEIKRRRKLARPKYPWPKRKLRSRSTFERTT